MTTAAMRCAPVIGGPKVWAQLTKPVIRAHRAGGANGYGPYPENTMFGALALAARGCRLINYDVQPVVDGTLVVMHDSTVDRTTNGTGTVSAMSLAAFTALLLDTAKSYGPNQPTDRHPPVLADMLANLGAVVVHAPEALFSNNATRIADAINAAGLGAYACISVGNVPDATAVTSKGITPLYLLADGTTVATLVSTYPPANGPVGVNYYQASPPGGTIDAYLQALVTAGYEVHVFSINRRSDLLAAMASVAAAGGVLGGTTSNDPMYHNLRTWVPRTTDVETVTGTYGDGFVAASGGLVPRVGFYGGGRFGYGTDKTAAAVWLLLGELAPLPATFTLTFDMTVEGLSSLASSTLSVALATGDLAFNNTAGIRPDGYYCSLATSTGQMQLFRNSGGGATQTSIGSKTSNPAVAPLLLTGALTSGAPVTSLAVRALPASVPAGTVFWLPTGQKVTTSALAASGATVVTVASVTPSALIASGSRCPQVITVQLQVTSTQIIITRLDTGAAFTVTDSTYRTSLYPFVGKFPSASSTTVADGATTNGSAVVTSATAAFSVATDEDKLMTGAGIPAGARILSVDSASQVTLTAPATATASGVSLTFYRQNNYVCWANFRVTA